MSDENTEEKKPEGQAPPKPWLLRQLERIQSAIKEGKAFDEIRPLLEELFDEITPERYSFTDEESQEYLQYASKWFQKRLGKETIELTPSYLIHEKIPPLLSIAYSDLTSQIWNLWWEKVKSKEAHNRRPLDSIALDLFIHVDKDTLNDICDVRWYEGDFHNLVKLAGTIYSGDPSILDKIGIVLERVKSQAPGLADRGKMFRARAQALWVKDELKEETKDEVKTMITEAEKSFVQKAKDITEEKTKPFDEKVKGVEARFIQIIGIFAAIIAFIVTIVPTAVRMGGASIPIALAGLAIVVTGVIILLAMIFGRRDKPSGGLIAGISIIGGLFAAWLVVTIWLAIQYPNIIAPQP